MVSDDSNRIVLQQDDSPTQFDLVTFFVDLPSDSPNQESVTQGRPFEFVLDIASKFSAMCPFCCAGFYIDARDIVEKNGHKFVSCPECGAGKPIPPTPLPKFIDPFVNPFDSKQLARWELDELVTPIDDVPDSDSLTVAQKISRATCKE
jgi:hypothetical protein